MILRKCKRCGYEAHSEDDLEKFARGTGYTYGRLLLCRTCFNADKRRNYKPKPQSPYLRKCHICGLEAHKEDDLVLFHKEARCKYGRQNICKKCYNQRRVLRRKTDEDYRNKTKSYYHIGKRTAFKRHLIEKGEPIFCYFCNEGITLLHGRPRNNSLIIHSLDRNHENWSFDNKVPAHHNCHMRFNNKGEKCNFYGKPNKTMLGQKHTLETKLKISLTRIGHKNPNWKGDDTSEGAKRARKRNAKLRKEKYGEMLKW